MENVLSLNQKFLLIDFLNLYLKILKNRKLTDYDFRLIEILEEYDFLIDYREDLNYEKK